MSSASAATFARYLHAKRSVDDRALNRDVYAALTAALPPAPQPLRVLEVGCGIGTMVARLLAWNTLGERPVTYHALDSDPALIAQAAAPTARGFDVRFECADFFALAGRPAHHGAYDLLIAHAVLDLLDLDRALPLLHTLLRPRGCAWLTLNFDGATIFAPPPQPPLTEADDDAIVAAYHATMETRAGASRTGRRLFAALPAAGLPILAAGASDWLVYPSPSGYPAQEQHFLHCMIDFFAQALADSPTIQPALLRAWLAQRRTQIDCAELIFSAHQYDFLAVRPAKENL